MRRSRREESFAKLADYRRISIEVLPGQQGAVWEYTFHRSPYEGKLRAVDRAFIAPSGRAYLLHWRTAPGDLVPAPRGARNRRRQLPRLTAAVNVRTAAV